MLSKGFDDCNTLAMYKVNRLMWCSCKLHRENNQLCCINSVQVYWLIDV